MNIKITHHGKDEWKKFWKEHEKRVNSGSGPNYLTLSNYAAYAVPMQNRAGYYVFNLRYSLVRVFQIFKEIISQGYLLDKRQIELALEAAGIDIINWHRDVGGGMRPPAGARLVQRRYGPAIYLGPPKAGKGWEGPRQAHPGGWADITGVLNSAYRFSVNDKPWNVDPGWAADLADALQRAANMGLKRQLAW